MEKIGGSVRIKKIAITGGLSTGKSTVCQLLADAGVWVIKADDIVHDLLANDPSCIREIANTFPSTVQEECVDRKKLADIVFSDLQKLRVLEELLHPKVIETIKKQYEQIKDQYSYAAFAVEIPLLYEIGFEPWFDEILILHADPSICKERFLRRGFSPQEYEKRSSRLLPFEKVVKRVNYTQSDSKIEMPTKEESNFETRGVCIITNNGSQDELQERIFQWMTRKNLQIKQ